MTKVFCTLSVVSGFLALALLALAGPSYRLNLLELGQAFSLMRWATFLGMASIPLTIGYFVWRRPRRQRTVVLALSALAGLCAVFIPLSQMHAARSVPPIHDISTDLEDPPAFVDILPLRKEAPNSAEYAGPETARQQREAYPQIRPLRLDAPISTVYQRAREVAHSLDWHLVSTVEEQERGRIEATDTTFWFGFKDDIVVRLRSTKDGTRVDVRSKSRVGKSDLGKNAERIQAFSLLLKRKLAQG